MEKIQGELSARYYLSNLRIERCASKNELCLKMSPAQFKLPLLSRQPILQNGSKTNSYLLWDDFICVMVPLNILEREQGRSLGQKLFTSRNSKQQDGFGAVSGNLLKLHFKYILKKSMNPEFLFLLNTNLKCSFIGNPKASFCLLHCNWFIICGQLF